MSSIADIPETAQEQAAKMNAAQDIAEQVVAEPAEVPIELSTPLARGTDGRTMAEAVPEAFVQPDPGFAGMRAEMLRRSEEAERAASQPYPEVTEDYQPVEGEVKARLTVETNEFTADPLVTAMSVMLGIRAEWITEVKPVKYRIKVREPHAFGDGTSASEYYREVTIG